MTTPTPSTLLEASVALPKMTCTECGMLCAVREFHPFAACLMFKACHDSDKVRVNLAFVRELAEANVRAELARSAQAVPDTQNLRPRDTLILTARQLHNALEFIAPDFPLDDDQAEASASIAWCDTRKMLDDDGKEYDEPAGHWCWLTDYPEEGGIPLLDEYEAPALIATALPAVTPQVADEGRERDWELTCDDCAGAGKVDVSESLHVDGRYMGDQLLRETCNTCAGHGFTVCMADIPKEIQQ